MGWAPLIRPDTDDLDMRLTLEQLRLVMRNLRPNAYIAPVLAATICVIYAQWVPVSHLAIWLAGVLAAVIPQGLLVNLFLQRQITSDRARFWLLASGLCYALFATAWSTIGLYLWVPHQDLPDLLIILVLACTLAGSVAVSGPSREISAIGVLIYGPAMTLLPLREGGPVYTGIAIMAFLYTVYMSYIGLSANTTATDMLVLMHERKGMIDRLKAAKNESDRARERAEQASQAKSQFLANMSHELRTPLNAILGFSEMIEAFAISPEKTREYSRFIHDSGSHLLALINDILDLAKIEAGGHVLREETMDFAVISAECVALIAPRASAAAQRLLSDIDPRLPPLFADPRALRQVLLNLLSNAVKFTPAGGEVSLFAHRQADGGMIFGVRDSGVGIAPDDLTRVFEKFGQGRHDVANVDKGTGLGLAIVRGLIDAHGGEIRLESTVGAGTCVTATLPAARCLDTAQIPAAPIPAAQAG